MGEWDHPKVGGEQKGKSGKRTLLSALVKDTDIHDSRQFRLQNSLIATINTSYADRTRNPVGPIQIFVKYRYSERMFKS
jgi:hypothetical protein